MIIQKQTKDLIRSVASKYNITIEAAQEAIFSQFKFIREQLESGVKDDADSFTDVYLKYIGKFTASKRKIEFFKRKKDEKYNGVV